MSLRRVVVTGVGLVTPLGVGTELVWRRLLAGESGLRAVKHFEVSDLACRVAGLMPHVERGDTGEGVYDPGDWIEQRLQKRVDHFIIYAMAAADQALVDASWKPETPEDAAATGVMIGSGIGGLDRIQDGAHILRDRGPRKMSPFFVTGLLINLASGYVSIQHGLKGPNHSNVTACSTGAHAVGDAARMVALGDADVMVAGGTESPVNRLGMSAFIACRALSTGFNDTPEQASRPYDRDRDGFVMGEGAGALVLEELEHAKKRGAQIYGEVIGYGMSGDAYHITAPDPDGDGAYRCMAAAVKRAGIDPREIDYVNAHGTSTPLGDEIELGAITRLFEGETAKLSVSSTKSAIGHLLGAAGAVEAIFSLLAIRDKKMPPTLNLENPSIETDIDLVPKTSKEKDVRTVLSNSFGFGGTNASLIFRECTD